MNNSQDRTGRAPRARLADLFHAGPHRTQLLRTRRAAAGWFSAMALVAAGAALMPPMGSTALAEAPDAGPTAVARATRTPPPGTPLTSVSLTFDEGSNDQLAAAAILDKYALHGTFFLNSGFVGQPGYMTRPDIQQLATDGHEIGGHTLSLADLASMPPDEAVRQVCNDRVNLAAWGFKATSFSYSFPTITAETEAIVAGCGYNSARGMGTVATAVDCSGCAPAEAARPADLFNTRATSEVGAAWSLADLKASVSNAEVAGGWLQLVFHAVDDAGGSRSVTPAVFDAFCAWLADLTTGGATFVRTVHEVVGGVAQPVVAGPVPAPAAPGENALANPGLETPGQWGLPQCWRMSPYGANSPTFTIVPGHNGGTAARLEMAGYKNGDAKVLPALDLGACAPTVLPGHSYDLSAWYTATESTQFELYFRRADGSWTYWTASPWLAPADTFSQARWRTPPVPADAVALSFGLNLFDNGTLTTDDYFMTDAATTASATTAPH
ncbi:polysaccharide deacetylase family protein [Pseudarthrobacter sp. P1]|uniref:polysaccharide deacetylase family protein n=1 Tax=Pseudarthrobacter sp. P1 TaxID=3418418 RepID=UPI003CF86190